MNPIILEKTDLEMIPKRIPTANKGTYKRVLVIAGSYGMAGAAFLAAYSAYRTGAGLVYILTIEENREILQSMLPEAIVYAYDRDEVKEDSDKWCSKLERILNGKDIVILGPGLGTEAYAKTLAGQVLKEISRPGQEGPMAVIDADCLNIISAAPQLAHYLNSKMIVTPHPGEMARLADISIEEVEENRVECARDFSGRFGVTTVLKGYETVIVTSSGKEYLNKSGTPALAKAGSGDVLSGVIAGLMCLGLDSCMAAPMGVYIHGLAGEKAAESLGEHSVLARDVADSIHHVIT